MSRALLACALLAACGDNIEVFSESPTVEVAHYATGQTGKVDIMLIVDNTMPSTLQRDLNNQIGPLFDAIAALPGEPSAHVGVTTTDLGTTTSRDRSATLPTFDACSGTGTDGVLTVVPEGADIATTLNLEVGTIGCDFEQPLGAMARALDNPANAGFVRDDANLLVAILSDEDDCSVRDPLMFDENDNAALGIRRSFRCTRFGLACDQPMRTAGEKSNCHADETSRLVEHVGTYVKRLRETKPDPTRVAVYAMSGPTRPVNVVENRTFALNASCNYADGPILRGSAPGVRLQQFASAFENGGYGEVCQSNFVQQVNEMTALVKKMAGVVCLDTAKLLDTGSQAGIQPTCSVTVEDSDGEHALHDCADDSNVDCFQILRDVSACPLGDSLRLDIHVASPDAHVRARCVTP